jgi:hypothetical protein
MPLANGAMFAGYTILRLLGSGGMGEVYQAQHPRLPRRDALNILSSGVSADEDYRQRFIREADLAATLWHPNIVRVNDRGEFNGQLWIGMDYVEGTDAAQLMRERYPAGMPADEVATIVTAIASALDYAHQQGLLHRDIKPANILLTSPEGGERRILLSDFGIARNVDDIRGLTTTNMTVGTVAYAAPEQLMGEDIDGHADERVGCHGLPPADGITALPATVGELGPAWLERKRGHLKPSAYRSYENAWRVYVEPRWRAAKVGDIRHTGVQAWIAELSSKGLSASRVITIYSVLAGILDDAVRDRMLAANPARGVSLPRRTRRPNVYLTAEQLRRLSVESKHYGSLILLLGAAGLRWGEAAALRMRDVDFLRRRVLLHENAVAVGGRTHVGTLSPDTTGRWRYRRSWSTSWRRRAREGSRRTDLARA